ncbi:hypothetical protein BKA82DRAFT_494997 [Pisolithus tinctorius]|nr:hypothetical protein BKA82DRAFT_494997 [Pisolithus tinctorius]
MVTTGTNVPRPPVVHLRHNKQYSAIVQQCVIHFTDPIRFCWYILAHTVTETSFEIPKLSANFAPASRRRKESCVITRKFRVHRCVFREFYFYYFRPRSLGLPLSTSWVLQLLFKSCNISCAGNIFLGSSKRGYRVPLQESRRPCGNCLMSTDWPLICHLLLSHRSEHSCAMSTHHRRVRCGGSPRGLIGSNVADLVIFSARRPLTG